ncbi:MAG: CapA family protein [Coriobacteriia bacterium]|nr:CapA family protein [Coriobacteriia bacterium]
MDERRYNQARNARNPQLRSSGENVRRSRLNPSPSAANRSSDQGENLWARNQRAMQEQRRRQEAAARAKAEEEKKAKPKEKPAESRPSVRSNDRTARRSASTARTSVGRASSTTRASSRASRPTGSTRSRVTVDSSLSTGTGTGTGMGTATEPAATPRTRANRNAHTIDARTSYAQSPRARMESQHGRHAVAPADAPTEETMFRQTISSVEPDHLSPTEMPFQAVADQRGVPIAAIGNGGHHRSWSSMEAQPAPQAGIPKIALIIAAVLAVIIVVFLVLKGTVFAKPAPTADAASDQPAKVMPVADADQPPADTAATTGTPVNLTISFAGDCTLGTDESFDRGSSFNAAFESKGDPSWFFANVADIFAKDDLTVANMEGTLTTETSRQDKTFAFKGDADYAQVLAKGNVDAASLANNHSRDYGEQSYQDTIKNVEAAGVPTFGYDRIAYVTPKDVKVALIGTYVLDQGEGVIDSMVQNIKKAQDEGAQIIAVYPHWGNELDDVPDSTQVAVAHAAIDAGATLVVGSHPHVIQGLEKYKGRYIVYSLGNFCFGGNTNPTDSDCMIFQQTFTVNGKDVAQDDQVTTIPCRVSSVQGTNNYQPTPAEGSEKERIQEKIDQRTNAIGDSVSKARAEAASAPDANKDQGEKAAA